MSTSAKASRRAEVDIRAGIRALAYLSLLGLAVGCGDGQLPTAPEVVRGVARWQAESLTRPPESGLRIAGRDEVLVTFGTGACEGQVIRVPQSLVVHYDADVVTVSARAFNAAEYCAGTTDIAYYRTLRIWLTEPIGERQVRLF